MKAFMVDSNSKKATPKLTFKINLATTKFYFNSFHEQAITLKGFPQVWISFRYSHDRLISDILHPASIPVQIQTLPNSQQQIKS